MSSKFLVYLGMTVGSIIGGYIPVLFGASTFSFVSVVSGGIGAGVGIWIGYEASKSV